MRHLKTSRVAILLGSSAMVLASAAAYADTPKDTVVMAKQIDDIISLDPGEAFEFSGGEADGNVYERRCLCRGVQHRGGCVETVPAGNRASKGRRPRAKRRDTAADTLPDLLTPFAQLHHWLVEHVAT